MNGPKRELMNVLADLRNHSGTYHPLTCGNDSTHPPLIPQVDIDDEKDEYHLFLKCMKCEWTQDIPRFLQDAVESNKDRYYAEQANVKQSQDERKYSHD
jgi:hypothetical protein